MARLKDRYNEEIAPALKERFGIENPMRIPRLEKIVVNMGVGEAAQNSRALDGAMEDLARITGQKAQLRRARKSIAGFKIREGMPVGARVTLQLIFPEISYDAIDATRGLDVAVVTTTESDEEARELLRLLGMPFRDS
jgi:large subunit ribosomal protein L5